MFNCPIFNKSTLLIFPLTKLTFVDLNTYLYQCYIGNTVHPDLNDKDFVFLEMVLDTPFPILYQLREHKNYITDHFAKHKEKEVRIFVIKIDDELLSEFKVILQGKYTTLDNSTKSLIISSLPLLGNFDTHRIYLKHILYPTDVEYDYVFQSLLSGLDYIYAGGNANIELKQMIKDCKEVENKLEVHLEKEWLYAYKSIKDEFETTNEIL